MRVINARRAMQNTKRTHTPKQNKTKKKGPDPAFGTK